MTLPMMPQDKANHTLYGAAVALAAQNAALTLAPLVGLDLHGLRPKDIGLAAAAVFGVGKEVVDAVLNRMAAARGNAPVHGVEALDALATFSGGVLVWAASP